MSESEDSVDNLVKDLRKAGETPGLLERIWHRLQDEDVLTDPELQESLRQVRNGELIPFNSLVLKPSEDEDEDEDYPDWENLPEDKAYVSPEWIAKMKSTRSVEHPDFDMQAFYDQYEENTAVSDILAKTHLDHRVSYIGPGNNGEYMVVTCSCGFDLTSVPLSNHLGAVGAKLLHEEGLLRDI